MNKFVTIIKKVPIVEKVRKIKWKRHVVKYLFPIRTVLYLSNYPDQIEYKLEKHLKRFPEKASEIEAAIQPALKILNPSDDEAAYKLRIDMLFCYFAYGFSINEYLCYGFSQMSQDKRKTFISDREILCLGYEINSLDDMAIYSDKMQTYQFFKQYYLREAVCIEHKKDFDIFENFISRHSYFVKKEVGEACGRSVALMKADGGSDSSKNMFDMFISKGKTILEEVILQAPELAILNESSVNTIRCITFNGCKGVEILYCFAKVGRKGAFIDNGAAGGILVGIDEKKGAMWTDGVDEDGIRYVSHPDSGVKFKGFVLPEWEKMLEICKEISEKTPKVKLIGWDMAYSVKGWMVVEGNALTEAIGPQSVSRRGIKENICNYLEAINVPAKHIFRS